MLKGKLICIEGTDGSGKTTVINNMRKEYGDNLKYFREPGSTSAGEAIRNILLSDEIDTQEYTDILLYTASRYELYSKIKEYLENGEVVLIDRFLPSTLVYQPMKYLFNSDLEKVKEVQNTIMDLHKFVDLDSTIVYLLDDDTPEEIQRRLLGRPDEINKRDKVDTTTIMVTQRMYKYVCETFFKGKYYCESETDLTDIIDKYLNVEEKDDVNIRTI